MKKIFARIFLVVLMIFLVGCAEKRCIDGAIYTKDGAAWVMMLKHVWKNGHREFIPVKCIPAEESF